MIYILHGDDTAKSRKSIDDLKGDFKFVYINGVKSSLGEILDKISTQSIFDEKIGFIIERFLSKKRKLKEMIDLVQGSVPANSLIIFWEDKLLTGALPKQENTKIIEFKLPKYYFQFLDSLHPNNSYNLHRLYEDLLKSMSSEQLYYSIIKRVRQLRIVSGGDESSIEETARLAPWQVSRLKNQATKWSEKDLMDFYNRLFDIEIRMKTSNIPTTLDKYIDILILTDLN